MSIKENWQETQDLIKRALNQSKTGSVDDAVKNQIIYNFDEFFDFIRSVLITSETAFYGGLLGQCQMKIDFSIGGAFDLVMTKSIFVVKINPFFMEGYSFSQLVGGIVQELIMIPLEIPSFIKESNMTFSKDEHFILEKATEASILSNIIEDIASQRSSAMISARSIIRPKKDGYSAASLSADIRRPISSREAVNYYYRALKDNDRSDNFNNAMKAYSSAVSFSDGSGEDATPENGKGKMTHEYESNSETFDEMHEKFKKVTGNAIEAAGGIEKNRGTIPGNLIEAIEKLLSPPQVKWNEILRQMVGTIPYGKRPTRLRLNRRQPYRSDLRGSFPDRIVEIICVFDTSGSMGKDDISTCMNEVFNITKSFNTVITIIECDTHVRNVYTVKKLADVKTEVHGRGGTYFTPAIEYINGDREFDGKTVSKGRYRNALMVYFTDGYGEREIPKPNTHRNLWVVVGKPESLSLKEPYGKVVGIETKRSKR